MPRKAGLTIEGTEDVMRALEKMEGSVRRKVLSEDLYDASGAVEKKARSNAPRQTGNLAENIDRVIDKKTRKFDALIHVGPNEEAWYGMFAEIGTQYQRAQPYLRPALQSESGAVVRDLIKRLRRRIHKSAVL